MYLAMYVCNYVYICVHVCMYLCMYLCTYVCIYVRMCCVYVCAVCACTLRRYLGRNIVIWMLKVGGKKDTRNVTSRRELRATLPEIRIAG